jgi:hypothetical protein
MQQNTWEIEKKTNARQSVGNSQILQTTQILQSSAQRSTYVQNSIRKCKCKCRQMKPDYQENLVKIQRNVVLQKKTYYHFQKWKLNSKDDENAKLNEQCTERDKNQFDSHYSSENAKEKQYCSDNIKKVHSRSFTNAKSNIKTWPYQQWSALPAVFSPIGGANGWIFYLLSYSSPGSTSMRWLPHILWKT